MNRAVFLDRDGTINEGKGYVKSWPDFRFLPGAVKAIADLSKTDYLIFVVTNQAGVPKKLMKEEDVLTIHENMTSEIRIQGGRIDEIFVCMHHPDEGCSCRKPKTKMVLDAARKYDLDLSKSWFVGDNTKDILCGRDSGCQTILVKTGYGGKDALFDVKADLEAKDLKDAISLILA